MPKVIHIKDLNKFPFIDRFHVKIVDTENKRSEPKLMLATKDLDLATTIAKDVKNSSALSKSEKVIVTKERIIQMY